jgi:hypothetical protein
MIRSSALFRTGRLAVLTVGALLFFAAACSRQGEGERCSLDNADGDCDDGLRCVALDPESTNVRCCPPEGAPISDSRCNATTVVTSGTGGSNASGGSTNAGAGTAGTAGSDTGANGGTAGNLSGGAGGTVTGGTAGTGGMSESSGGGDSSNASGGSSDAGSSGAAEMSGAGGA